MSGHRKAWHSGSYQRQAAAVRARADADPATRCWRCGRTRAEHRSKWQAGHVIDGQVGGELRAECTPCNASAGAVRGNRMRVQGYDREW